MCDEAEKSIDKASTSTYNNDNETHQQNIS